jgi:exosortase B
MSTVLGERPLARTEPQGWAPWVAILVGLAFLYAPTYLDLARGLWRDDEYAHGPIVLLVFAWLVWRKRAVLLDPWAAPRRGAGAALLGFGLALYLVGRSQGLAAIEVGSHLPVLAGVVLLMRGETALRRLAFPFAFLLFLVPLPGFLLDFVSMPLKALVSASVEALLRLFSYPVEREGVVLWLGDQALLVADACSGLNSLYSLTALGLLHSQLTGRPTPARTALLLAAIVPIAVVANIVRVLALVLVTHHLGPEAAQGFLHGFAGLVVFSVAFLLLVGVDNVLRAFTEGPGDGRRHEIEFSSGAYPHLSARGTGQRGMGRLLPAVVASVAMIGTAAAAPVLKPQPDGRAAPDLEQAIPQSFGDWRVDPQLAPIPPTADAQAKLDRLYKQVLSRTYVNSRGEHMMLTVAYGGDQSDALKVHRQEACYRAQGFEILELDQGTLEAAGRELPVTRMLAVRGERSEPVTYWFTMGDRVVLGRLERLRVQLENGLARRVPDGMLVRVSSLATDTTAAYIAQQAFVNGMAAALPAGEAARFIGAPQTDRAPRS